MKAANKGFQTIGAKARLSQNPDVLSPPPDASTRVDRCPLETSPAIPAACWDYRRGGGGPRRFESVALVSRPPAGTAGSSDRRSRWVPLTVS